MSLDSSMLLTRTFLTATLQRATWRVGTMRHVWYMVSSSDKHGRCSCISFAVGNRTAKLSKKSFRKLKLVSWTTCQQKYLNCKINEQSHFLNVEPCDSPCPFQAWCLRRQSRTELGFTIRLCVLERGFKNLESSWLAACLLHPQVMANIILWDALYLCQLPEPACQTLAFEISLAYCS